MPIYDADHMEHNIISGNIIISDQGRQIPAYWSHPALGHKFPGMVLLHDWWGVDDITRRLSNFFAQMGYYVIVPDLFDSRTAANAKDALRLVERYQPVSYPVVNASLEVLESHHMCNRDVAAVGIGMGGSLTFEAAIKRKDLEASIAFSGFPQNYLGQFEKANTPILAFYGGKGPFVKQVVVEAFRKELATTPLKDKHVVHTMPDVAHDFFSENLQQAQRDQARQAINMALQFLETHLQRPVTPPDNEII